MYGRSPVLPCNPQTPIVSLQADPRYVSRLMEHVSSLSCTAHHNISKVQSSSTLRYDEHRWNPSCRVNDIVLIRNLHRRYKFDVRFETPYHVERRTAQKTYVVQHVHLHHVIHTVTIDSIAPLFVRSLV